MQKRVELFCQEHNRLITHISNRSNENGSWCRCENCDLSFQILEGLDNFLNNLEKKKQQYQNYNPTSKKQKLGDMNAKLQLLKKQLLQLKDQINEVMMDVITKIDGIDKPQYQKEDLFPFNICSPSLKQLEESCKNYFDQSGKNFITKNWHDQLQELQSKLQNLKDFTIDNIEQLKLYLNGSNLKLLQEMEFKQKLDCNVIAMNNNLNKELLAIAWVSEVSLYRFQTQEIVQTIPINQVINNITFSNDDQFLILSKGNSSFDLYQIQDGKYKLTTNCYYSHAVNFSNIIISQNNEEIILGAEMEIYAIQLIPLLKKKVDKVKIENIKLDNAHTNQVYQLSFNNKKDLFISCSYDETVILWWRGDGIWSQKAQIQCNNSVLRCCFISNQEIMVQCSEDQYLRLFKLEQNKFSEQQTIKMESETKHNSKLLYLQYNQIANMILAQNNNKLLAIKLNNGKSQINHTLNITNLVPYLLNSFTIGLWNKKEQKVIIYQLLNQI